MEGMRLAERRKGGREEKTKSNCSKFMDRIAVMKNPRQQIQVNLGKVMAFNPHQSFPFSPFSRTRLMLRLLWLVFQQPAVRKFITDWGLSAINMKGKIEGHIGGLSELRSLDLSFNKGLIGSLSPRLGDLSKLNILILAGCSFSTQASLPT